jgi:predicted dehydrogenase
MEGVKLTAVADTDLERARAVGDTLGCEARSSAEEILPLVDAVSVVVPTSQHHAVARKFLRAGVDVLVEKPITVTLGEARDLIRTARRMKCVLQVGHLERFNAVWEVAGPALREPRFIEAHRLGPFQERGTDVDVVLDLMIHDIDICLKYVGAPVRRIDSVGVQVLSPNVDIANVRLHFANGTVANLTASRVSLKRTRKIRFFQPDLYVSVDCDARTTQIVRKVPDGDRAPPRIEGEEKTLPATDALLAELRSFIDSVRTRRPPEVDGEAGARALQVALRIVRRMRSS